MLRAARMARLEFKPGDIRLVVFDFDGVILESADIKTDAFPQLFSDYPQHQVQIRDYHLAHQGVSRFKKFEWIHAQLLKQPLSEARSKALGEQFSALVLRKVLAAPFVPGAVELLQALQGQRLLAVASGTPEGELHDIVERRGLARYFSEVCGTPRGKAEILRGLMSRFGCSPEQTLMIGDANTDFEAAREVACAFHARIAPGTDAEWQARGASGSTDLWPLLKAFVGKMDSPAGDAGGCQDGVEG